MSHAAALDSNNPAKASPVQAMVPSDSLWNIFHRQPTEAAKNAASAKSEVAKLPFARIVGFVA